MIAKTIYYTFHKLYPGMSDMQLAVMTGTNHSAFSKMKRDIGLGVKPAKWLKENHPEYSDLYAQALEQKKTRHAACIAKRMATYSEQRGSIPRFDQLPQHIQQFCGYIQRG